MTSENNIIIKHQETGFLRRTFLLLLYYITILSIFMFLFLLKHESISFIIFISVIIGLFSLSFIVNFKDSSYYLVDFYSDTKFVKIRYFHYNKEKTLNTTLDKINVKLKNETSYRSGFKCELEINVDNIKFRVNDEFDWSLNEIKNLFEYIQNHKSIKLTKADLFIIERIKIAINKTLQPTKNWH